MNTYDCKAKAWNSDQMSAISLNAAAQCTGHSIVEVDELEWSALACLGIRVHEHGLKHRMHRL